MHFLYCMLSEACFGSYFRCVYNATLSLIVPAYKTHSCPNICIITDNSFLAHLHLLVATLHCCITRKEEEVEFEY
jgi:hypothetical protein